MRPADLLNIAASAARSTSVPAPSSSDGDAFARALDSELRQTQTGDGHCGTGPTGVGVGATETTETTDTPGVRDGVRPERPEGINPRGLLTGGPNAAARGEWREFLQALRQTGVLGGAPDVEAVADAPTGKLSTTALVAQPTTSTPKTDPNLAISPFGAALDTLNAAIQAAIADPAANPAAAGQLPTAVQAALDAAIAVAPPQLQARMQAFSGRLSEGLATAMAAASGQTPAATEIAIKPRTPTAGSAIAQALLAAVNGAGDGSALAMLRDLQEQGGVAAALKAEAAKAKAAAASDTAPAPTARPAASNDTAAMPTAKTAASTVTTDTPAATPKAADAALPAQASVTGANAARSEPPPVQGTLTVAPDQSFARPDLASQTTPAASAPAAEAHAATLLATRGAPELVAQMAAVISRKLDGRVTRFNMELNPAEMGRVDVRLNIDKDGRVAAQMSFDNPAAAADMRGKADELRRQLEQSGFNVASEDLTFSDRQTGQGSQRQAQGQFETAADPDITRARAFRDADRNARLAEDAGRLSNRAVLGLDMRV